MRPPLCLRIGAPGSEAVLQATEWHVLPHHSMSLFCCPDPVVGLPEDGRVWPSRQEFWAPGSEALLLEVDENFFFQSYAPDAAQQTDARFRLMCADLHALPPALVLTCGVDSLRDEGKAYAEKLKVSKRKCTSPCLLWRVQITKMTLAKPLLRCIGSNEFRKSLGQRKAT